MEAHNPAGNSDSDSRQNQSGEDILTNAINLEQTQFEINNLHKYCNVYASEPVKQLTPFLCLYRISRECGGQEEGGWYYDWLTPVVCEFIGCVNLDDGKLMEAYHEEMRESHGARFEGDPDKQSRYPDVKIPAYWSASPRCATHVLRAESVPFASASHTRPHYE